MKVWLVSFFILFALVQFVLWLKNFFVPLPFYILGGACLAIASNYGNNLSNININILPPTQTSNLISPSSKNLDE